MPRGLAGVSPSAPGTRAVHEAGRKASGLHDVWNAWPALRENQRASTIHHPLSTIHYYYYYYFFNKK